MVLVILYSPKPEVSSNVGIKGYVLMYAPMEQFDPDPKSAQNISCCNAELFCEQIPGARYNMTN